MSELGFEVQLNRPYDQALEKVTTALKVEGFGVLPHIDVKATVKEKLGVDFRPYAILGACNPPLAHRALSANPLAGLMLPCNVTVEENAGGALVRIANPDLLITVGPLADDPALRQVVDDAGARLRRVAVTLTEG